MKLRERSTDRAGKRDRRDVTKAALSGALAGVAGAWAMNQFSRGWEKLFPASAGRPPAQTIDIAEARQRREPIMHASQQEWDSTINTATAVARKVLRLPAPLPEEQRERGAVAVHYAVGASMGAGYAVMRELAPSTAAGGGAAFGVAVWLLAQEIGIPKLGLSKSRGEYSTAMQANSLGEHVVFGIATELVRRSVRRML